MGLSPFGVGSIRGWVHSGFSPIRGSVPFGVQSIRSKVLILGSVVLGLVGESKYLISKAIAVGDSDVVHKRHSFNRTKILLLVACQIYAVRQEILRIICSTFLNLLFK